MRKSMVCSKLRKKSQLAMMTNWASSTQITNEQASNENKFGELRIMQKHGKRKMNTQLRKLPMKKEKKTCSKRTYCANRK